MGAVVVEMWQETTFLFAIFFFLLRTPEDFGCRCREPQRLLSRFKQPFCVLQPIG